MTTVPIGLRDFIPLAEGEFDIRSAGGAYIHGSRFGQLGLIAGQNKITVDKSREEIASRTGLFKFYHGGSLTNTVLLTPPPWPDNTQMRVGDVKRQILPTDLDDNPLPLPLNGGREFYIHVDQPLTGTNVSATDLVYDLRIGSVWPDGPLAPAFVPSLNVFQERLSKLALDLYTFNVDPLGNITTSAGLKYSLNAPVVSISGGTTNTLTSGGVTNVDGASVLIGSIGSAIHPAVRGDQLIELFTAMAVGVSAATTSPPGTPAATIGAAIAAAVASFAATLNSTKVLIE